MKGLFYLTCVFCIWCGVIWDTEAISNDSRVGRNDLEKNVINEEERRAAEFSTNAESDKDNEKSETKNKRGLFTLGATKYNSYPAGYDSGSSVGGTSYGSFSSSGPSYPYPSSHHGGTAYGPPSAHGYDHGSGSAIYGGHSSGHGGSYGGHGGGGHGGVGGSHGHGGYALKGLLIPLAGIALLGAAAALSTNPVLLQLGVVNGKRRRRRDVLDKTALLPPDVYPTNPKVTPRQVKGEKFN